MTHKVGVFHGYKIPLPSYGKWDSFYGMFTSEGFVTCTDAAMGYYECMRVEWSSILTFDGTDDEYDIWFENLQYDEW